MSAEPASPPAAYEVTGPSAFSGDLRRFLNLTCMLAVTEWKLRFFDSALGYLWPLMRPPLLFGVLYVVFSRVVEFGEDVAHYPVVLLTGIVFFSSSPEATSKARAAVVDNENLVRKIHFPRMAIPLSVVLTASFALCLNLLVLLGLVLVNGVAPACRGSSCRCSSPCCSSSRSASRSVSALYVGCVTSTRSGT